MCNYFNHYTDTTTGWSDYQDQTKVSWSAPLPSVNYFEHYTDTTTGWSDYEDQTKASWTAPLPYVNYFTIQTPPQGDQTVNTRPRQVELLPCTLLTTSNTIQTPPQGDQTMKTKPRQVDLLPCPMLTTSLYRHHHRVIRLLTPDQGKLNCSPTLC